MASRAMTILALAALAIAGPTPRGPIAFHSQERIGSVGETTSSLSPAALPGDPTGCTMTLTRYPDTRPSPTRTLYDVIETATALIHCGSCPNLFIKESLDGPSNSPSTTVRAPGTTTITNFRCRPTQTQDPMARLELVRRDDDSLPQADTCTTTISSLLHLDLVPTLTVWPATETTTSSVDCNGCANVVATTIPMGLGPVVRKETTVTAATPTTTLVFACLPTAGA
ncbi:unnamed protein product [Parascedosporium putredinis]|uniref:Uncharacterized protein n=1 Tax=Parascedosporium putredinis TaxID=1442378 RepID=A0A9P1M7H1_9PEZI|nr:unnamed protein product [Parascedosporium putredinis]CAI7991663.1 unnamed protein product [Parascedosporium putredinis]